MSIQYNPSIYDLINHIEKDFYNLSDLSEIYGISRQAIHQRLKRAGYSMPGFPYKGRDNQEVTIKDNFIKLIKECTTVVELEQKTNLSRSTLQAWAKFHELPRIKYPTKKGRDHHAFKKGNFVDKDGYVRVLCTLVDYYNFNPDWKNHFVLLHMVVFEKQVLGFAIPRNKKLVIHHIDENKLNNDPSNLALLTIAEHFMIHEMMRKLEKKYPEKSPEDVEIWYSLTKDYVKLCKTLSEANIYKLKGYEFLSSKNREERMWASAERTNKRDKAAMLTTANYGNADEIL